MSEYQTLAQSGVGNRNAAWARHTSTTVIIKPRIENRKCLMAFRSFYRDEATADHLLSTVMALLRPR